MTGNERRRINPNRGLVKLLERYADILVSRFIYPRLALLWNPYSWLLEKRFQLTEAELVPPGWPRGLAPLKVLLITDIHAGIFLHPETLHAIVLSLMREGPDLVIIAGDIVTGHVQEVCGILDALTPLAKAPLGAWYCHGNHDYFGGDPEELRSNLRAAGITTLRNDSVRLQHENGSFILGGIDDLILGSPDWDKLTAGHSVPHLLMAHNPDHFYEAHAFGVALTLAGHTHGGQIRLPKGPPLIRQSRYCLDEGIYAFRSSLLVVSRGLGSVLLPFRWGADPEAVLLKISPPR
ncbi:MAG: metallophosphoesterase [Deltaproteobacteria bacterium]|nr:metallophosphoesterase [Deltaproteobacteria bacterium]